MSDPAFWLWFFVPWVAIGVVTGWFMGRHGHHAPSWMVLGVAFGPMLVPAAVAARQQARRHPPEVLARGTPHPGTIDVLVGVDGSPAARRAVAEVGAIVGDRLGELTLAIVVDHDTAWNTAGADHQRAVERLEEAAATLPRGTQPRLLVLSGPPAATLLDHGRRHGAELVVVGTRGTGLTKALLGSVAEELSRRADVPVLLVPDATTVPEPDAVGSAGSAGA
jgi:nucleotide-binding universal stress UspA family protein